MDNFLQLVPIENDSDSDQGLVYGEDEAASALDEQIQIQSHAPAPSLVGLAEPEAGEEIEYDALVEHDASLDPDEHERREYLARAMELEACMEQAERTTQQRLDAMARILALSDPLEQLSEYMALKLDERREAPAIDIAPELLECAQRLRSSEDSEIALLGAFFFACESAAAQPPKPRGVAALLPVVAAMMESAANHGLEHHLL